MASGVIKKQTTSSSYNQRIDLASYTTTNPTSGFKCPSDGYLCLSGDGSTAASNSCRIADADGNILNGLPMANCIGANRMVVYVKKDMYIYNVDKTSSGFVVFISFN